MNDFAQNNPNMFRTGSAFDSVSNAVAIHQLMIEEAKQRSSFP
jgi:hypothetical protein